MSDYSQTNGPCKKTYSKVHSKLNPALATLLEAFDYSEDTSSDRWDFAVGIHELQEHGLSKTDLRWLVKKGYVLHAKEVTVQGQNGRAFRSTGDLTFCRRTCFVLTEAGVRHARSVIENKSISARAPKTPGEIHGNGAQSGKPHWDAEIRELRIDGVIVKRFKWQAQNQEVVLSAFEEDGWPAHIDDPLPPHPEQDSKRRLSDTIKCLNRKQTNEMIHFRGDGTGEGIFWEIVSQENSNGP